MASERNRKHHAVMISLPYQGHINPYVNLALKLASKGFSITFVHLEYVDHMLSKGNKSEVDLFSEARDSGLDIRYTTISDGFPLEFDRVLHFDEYWGSMFQDFPARVDQFINKITDSDPSSVHFLVTDTIYPWAASVAKKYNLVNVSFWTQPALVFSLIYHLDLLREHGHYPCKDNIEEEISYLPGVESINTRDIMPYLKKPEQENIEMKILSEAFTEVKNADFILHNTVYELEPDTLSALNKYQPNYAVGPINLSKILTKPTLAKSLRSESDCTLWLENKPPNSVLYVSFGSVIQTSKKIMEEIAYGLLLSEVNFVWIVRSDITNDGDTDYTLPLGFEDTVQDKGLIVQWCNQTTVLSNPAVKGFLTHCGWNSVLESIWCGVPMICYPVTFEQPTNRKLVVDDWKIGISLCDGASVTRKEVAQKIKGLMSGTTSMGLKLEMEKVRVKLQNAMEYGGSSVNNFDQFINDLNAKLHATTINY